MMSSQFFCKYANVYVYVYVHIQVCSFIYTHHIRFLKITKINEHHISLHRNHRHRHPSVKKTPVPSINPSVQRKSGSETHCVQRKSVFPKFLSQGFPMVSRRKKFTSQPPQLLRSFPWSFISGPWLTKKSMQVLISVLQLAPAASTASAQASTQRSSNDSKPTGDGKSVVSHVETRCEIDVFANW